MTQDVDEKYRAIADLLSPIEIAGLYRGLLVVFDDMLKDPHPRLHNVRGRARSAEAYGRRLAEELEYKLVERDPRKASAVADELLLWDKGPLRQLGTGIFDALVRKREQQAR